VFGRHFHDQNNNSSTQPMRYDKLVQDQKLTNVKREFINSFNGMAGKNVKGINYMIENSEKDSGAKLETINTGIKDYNAHLREMLDSIHARADEAYLPAMR
jgi:hypothetical protein